MSVATTNLYKSQKRLAALINKRLGRRMNCFQFFFSKKKKFYNVNAGETPQDTTDYTPNAAGDTMLSYSGAATERAAYAIHNILDGAPSFVKLET